MSSRASELAKQTRVFNIQKEITENIQPISDLVNKLPKEVNKEEENKKLG